MKQSKWLKWKLGMVGALGMAVLFHEVKASPAFEQASANAAPQNISTTDLAAQQDPVSNELDSNFKRNPGDQSNQAETPTARFHTKTGRS
jgi:hypothetical protein